MSPTVRANSTAKGAYAIPGLWDMHVHIFNQVSLRPANTWYFPLFVKNGVLAVREMWTKPAISPNSSTGGMESEPVS